MIICKECGFKNGDADSFCGACGSFLEWTGEKQAAPAAPVVEAEEEQKQKKSLYDRISKVIYADVGEAKPVESSTPAGPGGPPGAGGPGGPPGAGGPPRPGGPPPCRSPRRPFPARCL